MLYLLWFVIVLLSLLSAAINGRLPEVIASIPNSGWFAVKLGVGLLLMMSLWLSLMNIASRLGMVDWMARRLRPILTRLFPEVPPEHPAMGAIVCNIAANVFGLANAATPMGLKAMQALQQLNHDSSRASHAMCMFLAINTSSVQLIPTGAIAMLAVGGASNPTNIIFTAMLATTVSTVVGVSAALLFRKLSWWR